MTLKFVEARIKNLIFLELDNHRESYFLIVYSQVRYSYGHIL